MHDWAQAVAPHATANSARFDCRDVATRTRAVSWLSLQRSTTGLLPGTMADGYDKSMIRTIRAHFDGKVFVPDEPVDLIAGEPLELAVRSVLPKAPETVEKSPRQGSRPYSDPDSPPEGDSLADLAEWIENLPPIEGDDSPGDRAAQHDHYLYGAPKRP